MSFERRKVRTGIVVGDRMDKTVVVQVEWRSTHPVYRKSIRRRTRFNAHDEQNLCQVGDLIRIVETRPLSRTKRWRVAEILSREEVAEVQPDEIVVDESVATAAGLLTIEEEETTSAVAVGQSQKRGESDAELEGSDDFEATQTEDQGVVVQEEAKTPSTAVEEGTDSKLRRRRATETTSREEASTETSVPVAEEEKDSETLSLRTRKTVTRKKTGESTKVDVSATVTDETSESDRVMSEPIETSVLDETESESDSVKDKKEETKK